jgi:GTPase
MEIADLFVINKADRSGADETRRDLESMLDLSEGRAWRPPVVSTVASTGQGVDELWSAIGSHRSHLATEGRLEAKRAERLRDELGLIVTQRLRARAEALLDAADQARLEDQVVARALDPYTAADEILGPIGA